MLKEKLKKVPKDPGCYLMKNKLGEVIYVGKAKNLKRRLNSYFNKEVFGKTLFLVKNIKDFEYIITKTEKESLILENNLIKKYNPKYNILLKDDKSFPYIELTKEKIPRLRLVRIKKNKKYGYLFGPYTNVKAARNLTELLNRTFELRKCQKLPKKTCLYYDLGQCKGYCVNNISENEIEKIKNNILSFLKGNQKEVKELIKNKIKKFSDNLEFEKALEYKKMLDFLSDNENQKVELLTNESFDVFGAAIKENFICIEVFFVRNGKIIGNKIETFEIIDSLEEELEEYIIKFYNQNNLIIPKNIYVPFDSLKLLEELLKTNIVVPLRGNKKKILTMAEENALKYLSSNFNIIKSQNKKTIEANEELKELLKLDKLDRIEAFDNSHIFGSYSTSGMIVLENGVFKKSDYRKFKIESNDDYHSMKEVIYRRYFRVLRENLKRPDLIIVDGGTIQRNAALEVLNELNLEIPVYGLKKDDNHRTNILIKEEEIKIEKSSNLFLYLEKIQNEVHNYVISYHKKIRSKGALLSVLEEVDGLGEKRINKLFAEFGTISDLKKTSLEDLSKVIPEKVAKDLKNKLKTIE